MEFQKVISERFSVRQFNSQKLTKEDIDKILSAGHIATGCNYQPQMILVINSDTAIEKLRKCTKCHFNAPNAKPLEMHNKYRPLEEVVFYHSF